jgi:hypothetical protein
MAAKNKKSPAASAATPGVEATPMAAGPSKGMLALLAPTNQAKLVRRNIPTLVKPGDVPVGSAISGEIMGVLNSMTTAVKGKLLHLRHESGAEYTFPATGVIRQALAPGVTDEELTKELSKNIGKTFVAKRLEDKTTLKYSGKGEAPKKMFVFDVFTD